MRTRLGEEEGGRFAECQPPLLAPGPWVCCPHPKCPSLPSSSCLEATYPHLSPSSPTKPYNLHLQCMLTPSSTSSQCVASHSTGDKPPCRSAPCQPLHPTRSAPPTPPFNMIYPGPTVHLLTAPSNRICPHTYYVPANTSIQHAPCHGPTYPSIQHVPPRPCYVPTDPSIQRDPPRATRPLTPPSNMIPKEGMRPLKDPNCRG